MSSLCWLKCVPVFTVAHTYKHTHTGIYGVMKVTFNIISSNLVIKKNNK